MDIEHLLRDFSDIEQTFKRWHAHNRDCHECRNTLSKKNTMDILDAIVETAHKLGPLLEFIKQQISTLPPDDAYIEEHYKEGYNEGIRKNKLELFNSGYKGGYREGRYDEKHNLRDKYE